MRVGVEVGGTFTDLVAVRDGRIQVAKVPSTPDAPEQGALAALQRAALRLADVDELAHGSTVATNAVLERKGAHIAFVTSRGFRDLLSLQRNDRRRIYDLHYQKAKPLVRRKDCFEVDERMSPHGEVLRALDSEQVIRSLLPALRKGRFQAVAICLLNAYANPVHEEMLATMIGEHLVGLRVTCSSQVTREYREYERASTTAISAYVQPVLSGYLERFESALRANGFNGTLGVMQSNGGSARVNSVTRNAATALYSGPAAGVIGALHQVRRSGFENLITFDMGGTSTDVCLVRNARPSMNVETEIDGLPVRTPVIDIVTVGAGGGSIIRRDEGGMLRVGPESAAAVPGPACYGRGGKLPTITDAHVVRGTLRPSEAVDAVLNLDEEAAWCVFDPLAHEMNMTPVQLADSAIRLAVSNIVQAIHVVSTERGHDPRDYVLVPYGGAGPMHAARVAEALGVETVVVPPNAGVLSAFGLVVSDWVHYEMQTRKIALDEAAPGRLATVVKELEERAHSSLRDSGVEGDALTSIALYMRFAGQAFEIEVETAESIESATVAQLRDYFDTAYERIFLHRAAAERPVEIVSVRVGATIPRATASDFSIELGGPAAEQMVSIFESGRDLVCSQSARDSVPGDMPVTGPAILTDTTSTLYVPPQWSAVHDEQSNLIMTRDIHIL